jgi:hypothetical protein
MNERHFLKFFIHYYYQIHLTSNSADNDEATLLLDIEFSRLFSHH